MPTLTASERIGTTIGGRYELRRLIGEGGFSAVYEGVHTITGREVAVKILHGHLTATEQIAERFLMEARSMARIKHDGIVQVLDAGTDPDGSVFIALELLDGESLESTLLRVRQLTWGESVGICIAVLEALAEAHRHKIIHRDIKPGNIFIVRKSDGSSQAKLLDFGIAHVTQSKAKLTAAGMILGTPEYMSPEQGRTAAVGPESDLWSVGIVMWECLTGHTPFVAETATEILLRIATSTAPSILTELPDLPTPIAAVIDRSLERDIAARYHSADEMREAMQRALRKVDEAALAAPSPSATRAPSRTQSSRQEPDDDRRKLGPKTEVVSVNAIHKVPIGSPPTPRSPSRPQNVVERSSPRIALPPPDEADARSPQGSSEVRRPMPSPTPKRPPPIADADASPTAREPEAPRGSQTPLESPVRASAPTRPDEVYGAGSIFDHELPKRPTPPPGAQSRTQPLAFDERESRSFSGQKGTFQKPPESRSAPVGLILGAIASVLLIGVGLYLAVQGDGQHAPPRREPASQQTAASAADGQTVAPDASEPEPARLTLVSMNDVGLPQGVTGTDNATEFARHAAASFHAGSTQRMLATCIADDQGATLYLHPMTPGALRGSSRGIVACAGYDLGVVPDITADGSDDVVAVGARRNQLHLIDSRTLRPHRTIEIDGVRGIASGAQVMVRGEPTIIVFAEPRGPDAPSEIVAITALSSRVLWRVRGSGRVARVGHPVELGLAVGPDANGDGVGDVAAGLGSLIDTASSQSAGDQRCVQLFSGADGRPIWAQPFCRPRARGAQSVSVGPDVNNDGNADVAVGTDQPAPGTAAVVLLSGADGSVIRQIASPIHDSASGFGWPVALSGDIDGNHTPDLFVGTVGARTGVRVFDATTGRPLTSLELTGAGAGNLRIFPVPTLVAESPWSVAIASPGEGIRVFARHDTEEPL
jgi:eukaryotic-like serine/threonine-protein kinase